MFVLVCSIFTPAIHLLYSIQAVTLCSSVFNSLEIIKSLESEKSCDPPFINRPRGPDMNSDVIWGHR
jgi:hypothetical protein